MVVADITSIEPQQPVPRYRIYLQTVVQVEIHRAGAPGRTVEQMNYEERTQGLNPTSEAEAAQEESARGLE